MFENVAITEMFPTLLWVVDLEAKVRDRLNEKLTAELDKITGPRGPLGIGQTWQTDQNLHELDEFADLVHIITAAIDGALEFLKIEDFHYIITGCWANINPPGTKHSNHTHPNNYLSGVYYVKAPLKANQIVFNDPRYQAHVIWPRTKERTKYTGNVLYAEAKSGRLVLFPSWLQHEVPMNKSNEERISIAFNMMFTEYGEQMAVPMWKGTVDKRKRET